MPSYDSSHMFTLEDPSRACATVTTFEPVPGRIQKLTMPSWIGLGSPFTRKAYCVSSVATRTPKPPACAAAATTELVPVPCAPSQLPRPPDSNPSVKTTFVYSDSACRGVTAADAADARPVPTALIAATVNV